MAGIYGVLLKENKERNLHKSFYNANFSNSIQEEIEYEDFIFGRSVIDKFHNDRFLYENANYIVCFEGINYSSINTPEDFINAFEDSHTGFITSLKGNFSGFIFHKNTKKLFIFNDHLSTKDIYYFYDEDFGFAFSSEMHVLSKLLRQNDIPISYDYDGIYSLALYGQMFDDFTLVKEIKRLSYASVITYDLNDKGINTEQYFKFKKHEKPQELSDIIENLNSRMEKAISDEWQKDSHNGYREHLGLISGGMDSRINTLLAKKMGFNKINGYTYGDPNSSDVKIANQIAEENFYAHVQYNLHHGDFLTENILENYVKATDGLTHFTANAIIYKAFSYINTDQYGLVHSGQLGDTISGSFLKPNFDFDENKDKIGLTGFVKNPKMLEKTGFLKELIERYNYSDYEIFAYEQRQVKGTLMGDKVFNNFIDLSSPFYDIDLLNFVLSIPNKYKQNQRIYFEWLEEKHPELLNYTWEKIGLKPNSSFKINYGRLFKKYYNGGKKYLRLKYDNMNPFGVWFKENPDLLKEFDRLFEENIDLIKDKETRQDLKEIYWGYVFAYRNKFAVLTVVLAIRLHFHSELNEPSQSV